MPLVLAEKIAKAARYDGRFVWDTSKPNGQPRRRLDVSRAKERFGFEARTSFDSGVAATLFYLFAYGFSTLGAFAVVSVVRNAAGEEETDMSRWAGLGRSHPLVGVVFSAVRGSALSRP